MPDVVLFETINLAGGGFLGVAQLNSAQTLNSLSLEMVRLLRQQLEAWRQDKHIKMVFLHGAGDKALCAGGDIQNLYRDMMQNIGGPSPYCEAFFEQEYRLSYLLHTYPKPTLAWGHGIVMGGGLGILSACQHRIGTEKTRIAMPEITIGLFPDAGATWSFNKMPEHFAYFLAWTGASINSLDARRVGLVDHLIKHDFKQQFLVALAALAEPNAASVGERISRFEAQSSVSSAFPPGQLEKHAALIKSRIDAALSSKSPVATFLNALDAFEGDKWLEKAATTFRQGAPATAQILHQQLQRAKTMNLKEMFMQELVIAVQCSRHPDFAEGVRALLIDKDNTPRWRHAEMGRVPEAWVDEHFEPPWALNPLADLSA